MNNNVKTVVGALKIPAMLTGVAVFAAACSATAETGSGFRAGVTSPGIGYTKVDRTNPHTCMRTKGFNFNVIVVSFGKVNAKFSDRCGALRAVTLIAQAKTSDGKPDVAAQAVAVLAAIRISNKYPELEAYFKQEIHKAMVPGGVKALLTAYYNADEAGRAAMMQKLTGQAQKSDSCLVISDEKRGQVRKMTFSCGR